MYRQVDLATDQTSLDRLISLPEPEVQTSRLGCPSLEVQIELDAGAEKSRWVDLTARDDQTRWVDLNTGAQKSRRIELAAWTSLDGLRSQDVSNWLPERQVQTG